MKRKCLAIGIILLFIGVAVAPSINSRVVKTSPDNDLVEVTSQACGIQGFRNTTVKLTKQQYQNLELYLVDFRARLNQTTTKEEAVPIYKDAVVELNRYGLLPKGMSITQAQRLVTGTYQKTSERIQLFIKKNHLHFGENENLCCLLVGSLTNTIPHDPINNMYNRIIWSMYALYLRHPTTFMEGILNFLLAGFILYSFGSLIFYFIIPLHLFLTIGVGYATPMNKRITSVARILPAVGEPAVGTLYTIGLNGIKQWSGDMAGSLPLLHQVPFPVEDYPGIFGFIGLALSQFFTNNDTVFYLGSALWVNITSESLHL